MDAQSLSPLKVYYGWAVMNNVRKNPAISVLFENKLNRTDRKINTIKRLQHTCYVRQQTIDEAKDGNMQNRILTEYSLFLNQKPACGSIEVLLDINYQKDVNNVPEVVLSEIREALKNAYRKNTQIQGRVQP